MAGTIESEGSGHLNINGESQLPKITYTEKITSIFKKLEADNNYIAFELLGMIEPEARYHNGLKITSVDVSPWDYYINATIGGKTHPMKIGQFIRYFFKGIASETEIISFSRLYNSAAKGAPTKKTGNIIVVPKFKYNPRDVRATFLSLVTKTYPHGVEEEVLEFLPNLEKDIVGNYYKIIGNKQPETMFTSHLDTADRKQEVTELYSIIEKEQEYIVTDETTILGADDKAGIAVMLYMISNNVPGLYYFFIGEERGGIGSGQLSYLYEDVEYLKSIKRCVSFDRRNYHSVITQQLGRKCCSNEFASALCKEYNTKGGMHLSLDTTGIYTDSASFIDNIPECTNISVGYFHEHTSQEYQNITYLKKLAEASVKINWNSLPTTRKTGIDQEILTKHKKFISDIKQTVFTLETKIVGNEGRVFVRLDLDEADIESVDEALISIDGLLSKYKMDPDITFQETYLKIELR